MQTKRFSTAMKLLLSFICFLSSVSLLIGQNTPVIAKKLQPGKELSNPQSKQKITLDLSKYKQLKSENKLDRNAEYIVSYPEKPTDLSSQRTLPPSQVFSSASGILTSPPCSYVPTNNFLDPFGGDVYFDDGPPNGPFEVQLPFEFCFYGQTYNSFFINNNGNITFENSYATFTAQSFPAAGVPPMIAPFWGDVDTGSELNPLGQVRYNVYPEYAIVSWDTVAVYPVNGSLRNTFQVIISNGTSNVVPPGNNIAFIYADMQWTTGTASGGTGGFGGTPATVGVNRGDGADYIQLGLFNAPGTNYDGPFGNVDQVSFLDDNVFFFNTCLTPGTDNNIAPLAIGAPLCDTISVCVGSSFDLSFNFIPVEPNQTVDAILQSTGIDGLTITSITPGTQCSVVGSFTGTTANIGYNSVIFEATDNGTPAATYIMTLTFQVLEPGFVPEILGITSICDGQPTVLSVGGGQYDDYGWSPNGEASPTIIVTQSGEYSVTVIINGCIGTSDPITITTQEVPQPVIEGIDGVCGNNQGQLYTTEPYNVYLWNNFSTTDTITVGAGTYTVTATNEFGCSGISAPYTVEAFSQLTPVIFGDNHLCFDELSFLSVEGEYLSYLWSTTANTPTIAAVEGSYTVFVEDEFGCSGTSAPFVITQSAPDAVVNGIVPFCKHDSILVNAVGLFASYAWYDGKGDLITNNDSTFTSGDEITLVVVDDFGCQDSTLFDAPSTLPPAASFTTDPLYQTVLLPATIQYWDTSIPTGSDPLVAWTWTWNPNTPGQDDFVVFEQHPLINFPDTGYRVVTLVVTSEIGCKDTVSNWVYIIDKPFVPNVFSPGGDGYNDFFKVPFIDNYPNNLVLIFNRWGKKVFEGNNYKGDWDGDNLPSGTYYYVVSAPTLDKPLKGAITLMRN